MPASTGSGCFAELHGRFQVGGKWRSFRFCLLFPADKVPLELPKLFLARSDILPQGGQILLQGLGNIVKIVALTELMGNAWESFGDGRSQACFLVRGDSDHREAKGGQLAEKGDQLYFPANGGFPPEQRDSRQAIDDQVNHRLARAIVNSIDNRHEEATGLQLLEDTALRRGNTTSNKSFILPTLILDRHEADGKASPFQDGVNSREPQPLLKPKVTYLQDYIPAETVMGKGDARFFGVAEPKVPLRTRTVGAAFVLHEHRKVLDQTFDRSIPMLTNPKKRSTKRASSFGCRENKTARSSSRCVHRFLLGKINLSRGYPKRSQMYSQFVKIFSILVTQGLNVVESWNNTNGFIFYGNAGELATNRQEDQEAGLLALHLIQASLVYINTLMIQRVLADKAWLERMKPRDLAALSPLLTQHINKFGHFELDLETRLPIGA